MSLDFDRSPDGEPSSPGPAGEVSAPAQQAPAAAGETRPLAPSFTPAPVPADAGPAGAGSGGAGSGGAGPAADERTAGETAATAGERTGGEPTAAEPVVSEPVTGEPAVDEPTAPELTAYDSNAAPAWDAQRDGVAGDAVPAADGADGPARHAPVIEPPAGLDGPLLSDADELRASWQRIQAAFVDDPREAVGDAAGLVEHTAQALAGALRHRQRLLRATWDRDEMPDGVEYADSGGSTAGAASDGGHRPAADGGPDTEQLRLLIQRYRDLFNQLCRP